MSGSTFDRHRPSPAFDGKPLRWSFEVLTCWKNNTTAAQPLLAALERDYDADLVEGRVAMAEPKSKHLHKKVAKGKTYYCHRPTGTKIKAVYGTVEFWSELNKLNAVMNGPVVNDLLTEAASKKVNPHVEPVSRLISAYKTSHRYVNLAPTTKSLYAFHFNILQRHIGTIPVANVDAALMQAVQDRCLADHGYRTAQQVNGCAKLMFNWSNVYGWLDGRANPCTAIHRAERPRELQTRNRPWKQSELDAALEHLPEHLAIAVALSAFTGLRKGDAIKWRWDQYDKANNRIVGITSKQAVTISLPVHARLRTILDSAARYGDKIVASKKSPRGFTSSGFQASWETAKRKLQSAGLTGHLTFHGLRHMMATGLAEAGCSALEIMSVTGHSDAASVETYIHEASKKVLSDSAMGKLAASAAIREAAY